jgi:hypothetical protein
MTTETIYRKQIRPIEKATREVCEWPLTLVGVAGFEPAASSSRTKRAAKLRYTPLTAREV